MDWKEKAAATALRTVLQAASAGEVSRLGWAEGEHICRKGETQQEGHQRW
jgi:hypothetical protein